VILFVAFSLLFVLGCLEYFWLFIFCSLSFVVRRMCITVCHLSSVFCRVALAFDVCRLFFVVCRLF